MARDTAKDRLRRWQDRVTSSNKVYQDWHQRYRPDRLVKYYLGEQWRGLTETEAVDKYVINLIFPTIETQLPSLLFHRPKVKVEPRPPHADDAQSTAGARADLMQHTLQTFIDDPKVQFKPTTLLSLRDAMFRFGVIEVGYSADWTENPNAGKPALNEQDEEIPDTSQPKRLPSNESLWLKRIPPQNWRVSLSSHNVTSQNDWVGYGEWHYVEDVKANRRYKRTSDLKASGRLADTPETRDEEIEKHKGMVRLWKLWDLRQKVKHVFADGHDEWLVEGESYRYLPFAALKFYEVPDEWYPLPPVANWLSPQDEKNEIREMQKTHRRRFYRRYMVTPAVKAEERDKLESGGDGVYIEVPDVSNPPIKPVEDAPLDGSNWAHLAATDDDFRQITGVGGEQRGISEATTATQANIVNVRTEIRESDARSKVADWLADVCRVMLLCLREKMQLPMWIQANTDPFAQDPQAAQSTVGAWQQITADQLGDIDADVSIDIASLSPVTEDAQRVAWTQVLALLTNPALLMILMQSEPLLRKTLGFYGIKSEAEILEIQKVGQTVMLMQTMAAQGSGGAPSPGGELPATPAGQPSPGPGVQ